MKDARKEMERLEVSLNGTPPKNVARKMKRLFKLKEKIFLKEKDE